MPYNLKRVKVHAVKRELPSFVLDYILSILPIFRDKNLKADVQILYVLILFYFFFQPIGIAVLGVKHYIIIADTSTSVPSPQVGY